MRVCVWGRQQTPPSAPSLGKDPKTPASARVGRGQLRWGRLLQPYERPSLPGGGWHSVSFPHRVTPKMLPPARAVGHQQQAGSH